MINFQMKLLGKLQNFRATISEPEPGRVLVETNAGSNTVTTFIVDPLQDGSESQVTIKTRLDVRSGILGKVEGWMASRLLRPVYEKELKQLATILQE